MSDDSANELNIDFDTSEFVMDLSEELKVTQAIFYESTREINVRCPYCGDSNTPSSAHLYISKVFPFKWNCFRCPAQGSYISMELLDNLDIQSRDIRVNTMKIGKLSKNLLPTLERSVTSIAELRRKRRRPLPELNKSYIGKLKYLTTRLGRTTTKYELERFKFIFNLDDFLEGIGLDEITVREEDYFYFVDNCFGNLSYDESNITFRDISPNPGGWRYRLYNIFRYNKGASKVFVTRKDLDIYQPNFHLVAAEGVLDLLQIEHLFYQDVRDMPNYISGAIQGKDFAALLNLVIGMGIFPVTVDIYIDNEPGSIDEITKKLKSLPYYNSEYFNFNVFMNSMRGVSPNVKQDFGVPEDKIKRVSVKII